MVAASRLLSGELDGVALTVATTTFLICRSLLKVLFRRKPFGRAVGEANKMMTMYSSWLPRLIFGSYAAISKFQIGHGHVLAAKEVEETLGIPQANVHQRFLGRSMLLVANPKDLHHIFLTHAENYPKDELNRIPEPILGKDSLLSILDEKEHTAQRHSVSHAFGAMRVKAIADTVMRDHISEMIKHLKDDPATKNGTARPLNVIFDDVTMRVIGQAAFNTNRFDDLHDYLTTVNEMGKLRPLALISIWLLINAPSEINRRCNVARRFVSKLLEPTINEVRDNGGKVSAPVAKGKSLVELLAENSDLDPKTILDHSITFLFAGHETTASAMMWCCYYLARNQQFQETLFDELVCAFGPGTAPVNDQLTKLPYLEAVVWESLRMSPALNMFSRIAAEDDVLPASKTFVPKGTTILMSSYVQHRDRHVWGNDADEYRPERWIEDPELKDRVVPCSWIAFGIGKRSCIGRDFALSELYLGIAMIIRNFRLTLPDDEPEPVKISALVTKPKVPVRFRVASRT